MRAARSIMGFTECALLIFVVVFFFTGASSSANLASSLIASGTKSLNNVAVDSSRHKRAPGWGKRAPGWGKRQNLNDESYDDFQSVNDISNTGELYRPTEFSSDDSLFADNTDYPWGKRAPGWGKRAPGWGKRAPGWGKRAPGWGKRFSEEDSNTSNLASDWDVYVPRWVKRSVDTEEDDFAEMDRRAPGWGKRAPGWGKRAPGWGKRAPGWGKRAPGWGKRAPGWGKRAPGWGKRAPGWGKRAPGWGKRNDDIDLETNGAETDATYTAWDDKHTPSEELLEKVDLSQELINTNTVLRPEEFLSSEVLSTEKRAPGWGKRAPGWGKRNFLTEVSKEDLHVGKRAPGWGKRAPGWGKRAPGWGKRAPGWGKRDHEITIEDEISPEEVEDDKRAPGWGKRAIVKRAASHGSPASHSTHPSHDECKELQSAENDFLTRLGELAEQRFFGHGNKDVVNKPSRK